MIRAIGPMDTMRFETSQHLRLGQQMKLAPRMIQSMEILQMPLAELEQRIDQELEINPTLELAEEHQDEAALLALRDRAAEEARQLRGELEHSENATADFARLDEYEAEHPEAAANDFDEPAADPAPEFDPRDRDEDYAGQRDHRDEERGARARLDGEPDAKMQAMAATPARSASVADQLSAQWSLVDVDPHLRPMGEVIIAFLDDDGYLRTPLGEVRERAAKPANLNGMAGSWPPPMERWELALQAVQILLEPAGVAARDARECLLLQLDAALAGELRLTDAPGDRGDTGDEDPGRALADARLLVADHLDDLMKNKLPRVSERSGLTLQQIRRAVEVMRRLSLAPARRLSAESASPITPDVIVEYDEHADRYFAYLNETTLPALTINREYAVMSRDREVPRPDREFLKKNLSNATWLLDALEQRRQTLLRVVNAVLTEQRDWFDLGPDALRPLPMTQVAERLGLHVATVSRAVSEKWLRTPRGTVPLRGFFTGGLATETGEDMSYEAVRAAMREVIDAENKAKPLSDDAIARALGDRGIEIARRTVAKYRDMLGIPAARIRKTY